MHRNTYLLILCLAIFAALIVGLNIGKKMQTPQKETQVISPSPAQSITPTPIFTEDMVQGTQSSVIRTGTESAKTKTATTSATGKKSLLFTSSACGLSLTYPDTWKTEDSSTSTNGVIFTETTNPKNIIVMTCQKGITKPSLPPEQIETMKIGTITGTLYHDQSSNEQVDGLIFTHPKTALDVFIGGYGATFNAVIKSIKIL